METPRLLSPSESLHFNIMYELQDYLMLTLTKDMLEDPVAPDMRYFIEGQRIQGVWNASFGFVILAYGKPKDLSVSATAPYDINFDSHYYGEPYYIPEGFREAFDSDKKLARSLLNWFHVHRKILDEYISIEEVNNEVNLHEEF